MPLLHLSTSAEIAPDKRLGLSQALSRTVAKVIGKPEQYVMVIVAQAQMLMSGSDAPSAFVDLRSIGGLGPKTNRELAQKISGLLGETLALPPDRVYLNFTDFAAAYWGYDGSTFG